MVTYLLKRFVIVFLVLLSINSYGQWNNSFFDLERDDTSEGLVSLSIENLNYFRNSEYKSRIDEGRSLFGYQLWPELIYQASTNVQVSFGMFLQQDFGSDELYKSTPTFSLQFGKKGHMVRFGTLMGSMQHKLLEPIYDPERIIENRLENGFQYVLSKRKIDGEFWVDWQKMIYQNSPFREEFTTGLRIEPKLPTKNNNHQISLPISIVSFHKGGEIDTSKMPTISNFNFDYGLRYVARNPNWFDSIDLQGHAIYYEDISTETENYIDGLGQYVSVAAYKNGFGVMLNYWDSHQYHNPMGDAIFRTVSMRNPEYIFDYRKLIMARLSWEKVIKENLHFLIRTNFSHNLKEETNDFIAEFYFRWTPTFGLFSVKE